MTEYKLVVVGGEFTNLLLGFTMTTPRVTMTTPRVTMTTPRVTTWC